MVKNIILPVLKQYWFLKCSIQFSLYGPYGVCNQLKKAPFPFIQPILRKYGATIGKKCIIDTGMIIHRPDPEIPFKNLKIGDNAYIGHNNLFDLTAEVILGDNVGVGANCQFWTHTGDFRENLRDTNDYKERVNPMIIEDGVVIYSGSIVSTGVTIGKYSRIGAGSVIVRDTDPGFFYGGVPAKKIKQVDKQFYQ